MLSILATHDIDGYVPGINNLLEGGYQTPEGTIALSAQEKIERGQRRLLLWMLSAKRRRRVIKRLQV